MSTLLKLHKVSKSFEQDGRHLSVLKELDLEVKQGEFLILLGPSGSGKSTLLRIMAGLIPPSTGKLIVDPNVTHSFIFQDFALFPWLTVWNNIGFGMKMKGLPKKEQSDAIRKEIERMGLVGFEDSYPREISGGMKQRVGIARALALKPDLIFLDEPFSALDSFTATKLRQDLLNIWHEEKLTIVMVTHLIEEAIQLGDRIAVLNQRPAQIDRMFHNTMARPRNIRSEKFYEIADTIAEVIKI